MRFRNLNHVQMVAELFINKEFIVDNIKCVPSERGYRFIFDNARVRFGCCNYTRKIISLSKQLCESNLDNGLEIINIILHEIAHAISFEFYKNRGHNSLFRNISYQIGCDGSTCYDTGKVISVKSKYTLKCAACGRKSPIHHKPRYDVSCGKCAKGIYDPQFKMKLVENK